MTDQEQRDLWNKLNDLSDRLRDHEIQCARDNTEIKAALSELMNDVTELRKWTRLALTAALLGGIGVGGGVGASQVIPMLLGG